MTVVEHRPQMHVRKRNGDNEPVDVGKIVRAVERVSGDLLEIDPLRVATRTISGLYDGASTQELDQLSIQTAAQMIGEEPQYSRLAARLLAGYLDKEVRGQGVVGEQPTLGPGESFQYTSGCVLETPQGVMHGEYLMQRVDGTTFDATIAPFVLATPTAQSRRVIN